MTSSVFRLWIRENCPQRKPEETSRRATTTIDWILCTVKELDPGKMAEQHGVSTWPLVTMAIWKRTVHTGRMRCGKERDDGQKDQIRDVEWVYFCLFVYIASFIFLCSLLLRGKKKLKQDYKSTDQIHVNRRRSVAFSSLDGAEGLFLLFYCASIQANPLHTPPQTHT